MSIRQHKDFSGITVSDAEHNLSLFVDDILMHITNPRVSLLNLQHLLNAFGTLYGLMIHYTKSKALYISLSPKVFQSLQAALEYYWQMNNLIYLCIF